MGKEQGGYVFKQCRKVDHKLLLLLHPAVTYSWHSRFHKNRGGGVAVLAWAINHLPTLKLWKLEFSQKMEEVDVVGSGLCLKWDYRTKEKLHQWESALYPKAYFHTVDGWVAIKDTWISTSHNPSRLTSAEDKTGKEPNATASEDIPTRPWRMNSGIFFFLHIKVILFFI